MPRGVGSEASLQRGFQSSLSLASRIFGSISWWLQLTCHVLLQHHEGALCPSGIKKAHCCCPAARLFWEHSPSWKCLSCCWNIPYSRREVAHLTFGWKNMMPLHTESTWFPSNFSWQLVLQGLHYVMCSVFRDKKERQQVERERGGRQEGSEEQSKKSS